LTEHPCARSAPRPRRGPARRARDGDNGSAHSLFRGSCIRRTGRRKIIGAGHEQATLRLSIDADLTSVFNWNVKQLFVFITAEYVTQQNKLNQVVVWDHIITGKESARIHSSSIINKYSLTDQGYGLRGNDIKLVMHWNTIPITGLLTTTAFRQSAHAFTLDDQYS
jgi:signal peptidase complex subunit 3